jgi:selenide, water dikinase
VLRPLAGTFKPGDYPDLLVGLDAPDDAAIWKLDDGRAIVVTTDFFTPVVDDAYDYGSIAAANSLSDIYAMGGKPFLALNIAALPPDLPPEIGAEILRGGAEKAREAGVVIAGGHTVQDKEPKYGLVALGFVDPGKMLTKTGAKVGDALVLTKPLGFGTTTTALKQQKAEPGDIEEVVGWMKRLNDRASQLAVEFGVRACTDITGYSLMGHGLELARASGVGLQIEFKHLPFVGCAQKYARMGAFPGGAFDNKHFYAKDVRIEATLDEASEMLLFDPQTSGGLLMAVPHPQLEKLLGKAGEINQDIWVIGEVTSGSGIRIV